MKKFTRWVIYNEEWGVYLGSCIGLGFWSKMNPVGQTHCACFTDPDSAASLISEWHCQSTDYRIIQVQVKDPNKGASVAECVEAGLPAWSPDEYT